MQRQQKVTLGEMRSDKALPAWSSTAATTPALILSSWMPPYGAMRPPVRPGAPVHLQGLRSPRRRVLPVIAYMFSSVIMGILDAALAEGRRRLQPRMERMSAFERVSWTEAVNDIWLAEQAFEGMARAIENGAASPGVARGKLAIAELAEVSLLSISKAIGGASHSRSSPFGQWSQDVRALGLLRPPWAPAHHQQFEASFED